MEFLEDYIVSWDFSDVDVPVVKISRMRSEKRHIVLDVLGCSYNKSGVVSLRQIINEWEKTHEKGIDNES